MGACAIVVAAVVVAVTRAGDTGSETSPASRAPQASTTTTTTTTTTVPSTAPVATTVVPRSDDPVVAVAQQYDGAYVGTWENTTAGTNGPAELELRIDPATSMMKLDVDFSGDLFGDGADRVRRVSGAVAIGDPGAAQTVPTEAFGDVRGRLDPDLGLVLTADAVPNAKVDGFELVGRVGDDGNGFDATFTIRFADGSVAEGVVGVDCDAARNRPSEVQTVCGAQ
jgi:hypothetical protein